MGLVPAASEELADPADLEAPVLEAKREEPEMPEDPVREAPAVSEAALADSVEAEPEAPDMREAQVPADKEALVPADKEALEEVLARIRALAEAKPTEAHLAQVHPELEHLVLMEALLEGRNFTVVKFRNDARLNFS